MWSGLGRWSMGQYAKAASKYNCHKKNSRVGSLAVVRMTLLNGRQTESSRTSEHLLVKARGVKHPLFQRLSDEMSLPENNELYNHELITYRKRYA